MKTENRQGRGKSYSDVGQQTTYILLVIGVFT